MSVAVTKAVEDGATVSSARRPATPPRRPPRTRRGPGIEAIIVVAAGGGVQLEARAGAAVGGRIVEIDGTFDDAYDEAVELAVDGRRARQLDEPAPHRGSEDRCLRDPRAARRPARRARLLPYGGGGNTKAYARGFREQTGDAAALSTRSRRDRADTVASAIRIVEPIHREEVETVDRAVGAARFSPSRRRDHSRPARLLGREEGVFCEPASAAGIAGRRARLQPHPVSASSASMTGHGLKDPTRCRGGG